MSEKDINRWGETVNPARLRPTKWETPRSWNMAKIQPITDEMLSELTQRFAYAGTPWNCHSLPLSTSDREYMYLLYYSMQGLIARMRWNERELAAVVECLQALAKETLYESGQMQQGISVRFLARLNMALASAGLFEADHPLAIEARALFNQPAQGRIE